MALSCRKLKDLVKEDLRLVLAAPPKARRNPSLPKLMKRAQGVIDSGVPDLASNLEYFKDFGRDAGQARRRDGSSISSR
jgi:predicted component of type VI protein secretion system